MQACPCGSTQNYAECCERFISGAQIPQTPEELMRSRYTAYALANADYIADTMRGPAAIGFDKAGVEQWATQIQWQGLKVIKSSYNDTEGTVEFLARYAVNNNSEIMYEISEFIRENGRWYYIDGVTPKIGRNDHCPCGSNKKYKKCCG